MPPTTCQGVVRLGAPGRVAARSAGNLRLHDARGVLSAAEGEYGGREPSCHRDRDGDGAAAALALGVEQGDAQAAIAQPR
jgi:hypothetical protein